MNKRNLDIAYFLSFCIEQFKKEKNVSFKHQVSNSPMLVFEEMKVEE